MRWGCLGWQQSLCSPKIEAVGTSNPSKGLSGTTGTCTHLSSTGCSRAFGAAAHGSASVSLSRRRPGSRRRARRRPPSCRIPALRLRLNPMPGFREPSGKPLGVPGPGDLAARFRARRLVGLHLTQENGGGHPEDDNHCDHCRNEERRAHRYCRFTRCLRSKRLDTCGSRQVKGQSPSAVEPQIV